MKPFSMICLALVLLMTSCSSSEKSTELQNDNASLGELQHGFTLNEGTQEKFEEGLLLLHNFEYDDALTAFEAATAIDSTEIMTHWGEAMCHYKALWRLQNTEKGKAILARLGTTKEERLSAIDDELEKALWQIIEIMYGEGEFDERNKKITAHMASLHQRYPTNQEIAAFYALSLIWATEEYGDGSNDLRLAASIADDIIKANPLHPGALHYKIHALDGPTSAADAHAAADAYAQVAAAAAHALHMPSHIYLALGEWDGVVSSNQVSYDASVERMKKLELTDGARGYHSFAWLHYGLLQQGRYEEAEQVLQEMIEYVPKDPTKGARGYLLGMQNRQIVESGAIADPIAMDLNVKVDDIGLMAKSMRSFLRSQIAYRNNDITSMQDEIKWLNAQISMASEQVEGNGIAMCAAGTSRYAPTENAINSAKVVVHQIKGFIALSMEDNEQFEIAMRQAVALEEQTNYPAGPPRITLPSFEQYGEWLNAQGQYEKAMEQFNKSLERMPKRHKSLSGKLTALESLGIKEEAGILQDQLREISDKALSIL